MGVLPLAGRTDGAAYAHSMNKMLEDVGVEPTDFLAVVSDHDARGVCWEVQRPGVGHFAESIRGRGEAWNTTRGAMPDRDASEGSGGWRSGSSGDGGVARG